MCRFMGLLSATTPMMVWGQQDCSHGKLRSQEHPSELNEARGWDHLPHSRWCRFLWKGHNGGWVALFGCSQGLGGVELGVFNSRHSWAGGDWVLQSCREAGNLGGTAQSWILHQSLAFVLRDYSIRSWPFPGKVAQNNSIMNKTAI